MLKSVLGLQCLTKILVHSRETQASMKTKLFYCGVSGRTGTYFEQPRHSEYGLSRLVVVQASSSTGLR